MLTTARGRGMFSGVRAVIVDEIHAIAGTKRGVHLALTLERLEQLCEHAPQRIGLSATQTPLDEIARFLGGYDRDSDERRPCQIVDCGLVKQLELTVESPVERPRARRRNDLVVRHAAGARVHARARARRWSS